MKYRVKSPILSNGKRYEVGEIIELPKTEADRIPYAIEPLEKPFNASELQFNLQGE